MIRTRGLTHIALTVADLDRSARFYTRLVGAVEVYRDAAFVQLQTPGSWDVIVLEQGKRKGVGRSGGIAHFGFRLIDPRDIDRAADIHARPHLFPRDRRSRKPVLATSTQPSD